MSRTRRRTPGEGRACVCARVGVWVSVAYIRRSSHTITVSLGKASVAQSPYRVNVDGRVSTKQTRCFGPGLSKTDVVELVPTHFTIETRDKNGRVRVFVCCLCVFI